MQAFEVFDAAKTALMRLLQLGCLESRAKYLRATLQVNSMKIHGFHTYQTYVNYDISWFSFFIPFFWAWFFWAKMIGSLKNLKPDMHCKQDNLSKNSMVTNYNSMTFWHSNYFIPFSRKIPPKIEIFEISRFKNNHQTLVPLYQHNSWATRRSSSSSRRRKDPSWLDCTRDPGPAQTSEGPHRNGLHCSPQQRDRWDFAWICRGPKRSKKWWPETRLSGPFYNF